MKILFKNYVSHTMVDLENRSGSGEDQKRLKVVKLIVYESNVHELLETDAVTNLLFSCLSTKIYLNRN